MKQMQMKLTSLKNYLPRNWATIIAENHGVTGAYVRYVMQGERINIDIAQSIVELAGAHKKKIQEIKERAGNMKNYRIIFTKRYNDGEYTNTAIIPAANKAAAEKYLRKLVQDSNPKEQPLVVINEVQEVSIT
jgi:hypothetical protein